MNIFACMLMYLRAGTQRNCITVQMSKTDIEIPRKKNESVS